MHSQLELAKPKPDMHDSFDQNSYNEDHAFYSQRNEM
jgi:hypothetical protein